MSARLINISFVLLLTGCGFISAPNSFKKVAQNYFDSAKLQNYQEAARLCDGLDQNAVTQNLSALSSQFGDINEYHLANTDIMFDLDYEKKGGAYHALTYEVTRAKSQYVFYETLKLYKPIFGGPIKIVAIDVKSDALLARNMESQTIETKYSNGNIKSQYQIKNNVQDGLTQEFYESGKIHSEVQYKNGMLHGESKTYYESGELQGVAIFKEGKPDGMGKYYHKNGKIKLGGLFKNGMREGQFNEYNEDGTLKDQKTYINGEMISGAADQTISTTQPHQEAN